MTVASSDPVSNFVYGAMNKAAAAANTAGYDI